MKRCPATTPGHRVGTRSSRLRSLPTLLRSPSPPVWRFLGCLAWRCSSAFVGAVESLAGFFQAPPSRGFFVVRAWLPNSIGVRLWRPYQANKGISAQQERAGAREDACPPGSRGWTMAQRPARPGGRSSPSRHNGREGHGQVFPPVNELVDLDVHLLAGRRRPEPGRIQVGDVGRALHGTRAHPEDSEVPAGLTALTDRLGAANDGVRPGVARAAQLEGIPAFRFQLSHFSFLACPTCRSPITDFCPLRGLRASPEELPLPRSLARRTGEGGRQAG